MTEFVLLLLLAVVAALVFGYLLGAHSMPHRERAKLRRAHRAAVERAAQRRWYRGHYVRASLLRDVLHDPARESPAWAQ